MEESELHSACIPGGDVNQELLRWTVLVTTLAAQKRRG